MEQIDYKWLASELVAWFAVPENYSIVHFAIEQNMSKEKLFRLASESSELQDAVDYGMSVQEYKLSHGALTGTLATPIAMKMLETYNGWKSDVNLIQRNEYKQFMNEASEKAAKILGSVEDGSLVDAKDTYNDKGEANP